MYLSKENRVVSILFLRELDSDLEKNILIKGVFNLFSKYDKNEVYPTTIYQAEFKDKGVMDYWLNSNCKTITKLIPDNYTELKEKLDKYIPYFEFRSNKAGLKGIMIGPYWTEKLNDYEELKDIIHERFGKFDVRTRI